MTKPAIVINANKPAAAPAPLNNLSPFGRPFRTKIAAGLTSASVPASQPVMFTIGSTDIHAVFYELGEADWLYQNNGVTAYFLYGYNMGAIDTTKVRVASFTPLEVGKVIKTATLETQVRVQGTGDCVGRFTLEKIAADGTVSDIGYADFDTTGFTSLDYAVISIPNTTDQTIAEGDRVAVSFQLQSINASFTTSNYCNFTMVNTKARSFINLTFE